MWWGPTVVLTGRADEGERCSLRGDVGWDWSGGGSQAGEFFADWSWMKILSGRTALVEEELFFFREPSAERRRRAGVQRSIALVEERLDVACSD